MTDPASLTAMRYLAGLRDMLAEQGLDTTALLAGTGLTEKRLEEPGAFSGREEFETFIANARALSGDPLLGFHLGRRLNLSAHGTIGFAGLTAADVGQALALAVRFFPLVTSLIRPALSDEGEYAVVRITPLPGLNPATEQFLVQTLIASVDLMAGFLLGGQARALHIDLADGPVELEKRRELSASTLDCRAREHCIRLPSRLLEIPFALADTRSAREAVRRCEEELGALERLTGFHARLYQQLLVSDQAQPSLEEIAAQLHVSSRTVHRRLATEGVRFRDLANRARIEKARRLLGRGGSVTATAHRLGYGDSANFTRAFRRHTGMTPSDYMRTCDTGRKAATRISRP